MTRQRSSLCRAVQTLRRLALGYPEAREGVSCEGTSAQRSTVKARNKAFLFFGVADAMIKLRESLAEAIKLASKDPARYRVGAHGWVRTTFGPDESPSLSLLEKWIDESYRAALAEPLARGSRPARKGPRQAARRAGRPRSPRRPAQK
jgi:hypothetical protein